MRLGEPIGVGASVWRGVRVGVRVRVRVRVRVCRAWRTLRSVLWPWWRARVVRVRRGCGAIAVPAATATRRVVRSVAGPITRTIRRPTSKTITRPIRQPITRPVARPTVAGMHEGLLEKLEDGEVKDGIVGLPAAGTLLDASDAGHAAYIAKVRVRGAVIAAGGEIVCGAGDLVSGGGAGEDVAAPGEGAVLLVARGAADRRTRWRCPGVLQRLQRSSSNTRRLRGSGQSWGTVSGAAAAVPGRGVRRACSCSRPPRDSCCAGGRGRRTGSTGASTRP